MGKPRLETLVERQVFAEDGTPWRVRETRLHNVPGAQKDFCLICDSGKVCRRVWDYPDAWSQLAAPDLLALLERPLHKS